MYNALKPIVLLFLLTIVFKGYSQTNIVLDYNNVHIGQNIMLGLKKDYGKHSIIIGGKYHINSLVHDNNNNIFRNRFYATNLIEHLGLNLRYQYYFNPLSPSARIFCFYDFQYTNSPTRNVIFSIPTLGTGIDYPEPLYVRRVEHFGPFSVFENYIGLGIEFKVYDFLYFNTKCGVGVSLFKGEEIQLVKPEDALWPSLSAMFSLGISYRFNK